LNLPDVILVKKTFPKLRRRQKKRFWKLKHFEDADKNMDDGGLDEENEDEEPADEEKAVDKRKKLSKKQIKKQRKEESKDVKTGNDYEYFLRDLEDDPELRANVGLYRDDDVMAELEAKIAKMGINDEPSK